MIHSWSYEPSISSEGNPIKETSDHKIKKVKDEFCHVVSMAKGYIRYCRNIGLTHIPVPYDSSLFSWLFKPDKASLEQLARYLGRCQSCPLAGNRQAAVPGEGHLSPRLVLIGQSPGKEESEKGKPFLGEAGDLLNQILSSVQLSREEVYLTYALKCPFPPTGAFDYQTIRPCRELLFRELRLLRPDLIATLGPFATQIVLGKKIPLAEVRGKIITLKVGEMSLKVVPTYDPDYLIQYPDGKPAAWLDIQLIRKEYDRKR
ncbi:MAG: uracil-DNA glycosylase [bacterium]